MLSTVDPDFMRSMCKAAADWQGFRGDQQIITRIHGENDKVISCHGRCIIIENGGYLIAVIHACECIEILNYSLTMPLDQTACR